jgi:gamma-glutamyl hydrolase
MASVGNFFAVTQWLTVVLLCRGFDVKDTLNNRPIIGVMSQATHGKIAQSYIAASYVKYLESSGARVVPIMNDLNEEETKKLFNSINGVLFPGGGVNLNTSGYAKIGKQIVDLAKTAFDKGDYFPIWGTCLGLEFLTTLIGEDVNILSHTDSENLTLPLIFSQDYRSSKMFGNIDDSLVHFLSSASATFNEHQYSLLTSSFATNQKVKRFFRILSTNKDRNGLEFVSTIEGFKYPIFASQWHPEKNAFEWTLREAIPHENMSIKVTQFMSNFFVNQARLNHHKFASPEEEEAALIYNFNPIYTGNVSSLEQSYFFKSKLNVII